MAEKRTVGPNGNGEWEVKKPGANRASGVFPTQGEAIERGRQILKNEGGGELHIKGTDGKIRKTDTVPPGNDPRKSNG